MTITELRHIKSWKRKTKHNNNIKEEGIVLIIIPKKVLKRLKVKQIFTANEVITELHSSKNMVNIF